MLLKMKDLHLLKGGESIWIAIATPFLSAHPTRAAHYTCKRMSFWLRKSICLYSASRMISGLKRENTHYSKNIKSNIKIYNVNICLPRGKLSKSKTVQADESVAQAGRVWSWALISQIASTHVSCMI